jgi:hypothetical protein
VQAVEAGWVTELVAVAHIALDDDSLLTAERDQVQDLRHEPRLDWRAVSSLPKGRLSRHQQSKKADLIHSFGMMTMMEAKNVEMTKVKLSANEMAIQIELGGKFQTVDSALQQQKFEIRK